jgi:hypothetical protein
MSPLRARMIEDMTLAGLAVGDAENLHPGGMRLAAHYRRSPNQLSEEEVRGYMLDLRQRGVARGTFQTSQYGLRFTLGPPRISNLQRRGLQCLTSAHSWRCLVWMEPGAAAEAATTSARERSRLLRRIDVTHELMSELPSGEDLSFLHSGLCQTRLPPSGRGSHGMAAQVRAVFADSAAWCVRSRRRRPVSWRPVWPESAADSDLLANRGHEVPHGQPWRIVQGIHAEPGPGHHWRETWDDWGCARAVPSHLAMQFHYAVVGRYGRRSSDCHRQYAHRRPVGVVELR